MEIKFNPSIGNTAANQPVARANAPAASQDNVSLDKTSALKTALENISLVRPEKVDAARAAVADQKFPPDEMLNSLASFLAEKIQ